jgi:hypothetical protein
MAYSLAELLAAAKAIIRGVDGIGTEAGADLDLVVDAAARLFQGTQVAAAHIDQQADPSRADAQGRDQWVDLLGLQFAKPATPARGLVAFVHSGGFGGPLFVPAGYVIDFPGSCFVDGVARSYRTTQDFTHVAAVTPATSYELASGSSIRKVRVKSADGVTALRGRALLSIATDDGARVCITASKRVNTEDQSVDLYNAMSGTLQSTANEQITQYVLNSVIEVECTEVGAVGNAPRVIATYDASATAPDVVLLIEAGGGGDEVGDIDGDTARVVRMIEDTIAMPPAFGNAQHWREIALTCPDVDLDDAIVYQGVRGPGTMDIVCIGRSGSIRSSAFPDANLSFCGWGNNARRIGDAQVEILQSWCASHASYFDDIRVRSVEWDWRGNTLASGTLGAVSFLRAVCTVETRVTPQDGYGPDCGVTLDVTPYQRHASKLYSPTNGVRIDASLAAGQRVWVTVGPSTTDGHHSFATVVTTILSVDSDRMFVTVADLSAIGPAPNAYDNTALVALRWGSAGPLTQACLDATFAYFDGLGPGSYTEPPKGPGYMRHFNAFVTPALAGHAMTRWPAEGRRWSSGLRANELRASLLAVEGVKSVALAPVGASSEIVDFDATPLQTLALSGAVVRYQ